MRLTVLLLLACCTTVAVGQTYKWRDANGRIQYTDTPPPAGAKDVQTMQKTRPSGASTPAAAPPSVADQEAQFRKRLAEQEESKAKSAKAEEEERMRARNCEQARGQLAALQSGGRMVRFNDAGERIAIDDAERERSTVEAQKAIENWCGARSGAR